MGNKIIKTLVFTLLILTQIKCGRDAACDGQSISVDEKDLVVLSPLQNTYNQGDEITVKVTVPAALSKYAFDISGNLFGEFIFTRYSDNEKNLFFGNPITFSKGSISNSNISFFLTPYNFVTGSYELEFKVKLNRIGIYKILSNKNSDTINFIGSSSCNTVSIVTNKLNPNNTNEIIFTVI